MENDWTWIVENPKQYPAIVSDKENSIDGKPFVVDLTDLYNELLSNKSYKD